MSALDQFLGQQDAFFASIQSRESQVRKRAQWKARGGRYLRATNLRFDAAQMVSVDTDMQRMAFNFVRQAYPRIADAFEKRMVPVAEDAFKKWPVKTRLSKSLLTLSFHTNDTQFTATIRNNAPYAFFINNNRAARDPANSYKGLIFEPGDKAAEQLAKDLADVIGD